MGAEIHRKAVLILIGIMFAACLLLTGCAGGESSGSLAETDVDAVLRQTAQARMSATERPAYASTEGEWLMIALTRSGTEMEPSYREIYLTNLRKALKDTGGVLSEKKYTEYARVALALTALGEDPTDFDGYDLLAPLADFDTVTEQGLNGAAYALMALNSGDYKLTDADSDSDVRERYVDWLLQQEHENGGFSLTDTASEADADLTAIVLQSLIPYEGDEAAKAALQRGVDVLSILQDEEGYYESYGERSCESTAQAIIALSALGIDSNTDERFVKNGMGMVDVLLTYYDGSGGFSHAADGESNVLATEQALCALTAYERFLQGKTALLDMTDAE